MPNASSVTGTTATGKSYVGRFAPSPTGPLHFGSLVGALVSYVDARAAGGRWQLRIEDIDPPREQPGASAEIVTCLAAHGFEWDGDVRYQHTRAPQHEAAIAKLFRDGHAYFCRCTRRAIREAGGVYDGRCRDAGHASGAVRVRTDDSPITVPDRLQAPLTQRLESELGDFIIRRRDGLVAYQLAVVVDDAQDGITDVVRGIDLYDSTPRQVWLQQLLGLATPRYAHFPVVVGSDGDKLSKQTGAPAVDMTNPPGNLADALQSIRHAPPDETVAAGVAPIWRWAIANWKPARLRGVGVLHLPPAGA